VPGRLEDWFAHAERPRPAALALLGALQVSRDEFWSRHWTLHSPRLPRSQPLLGATRVTDLAVNVILPWFWMRAHTGRNETLRLKAEAIYLDWPRAQDNAVLRLARARLLGESKVGVLRTAAEQQGLLQIVRDFCEHSNAACAECRFPEFVKRLVQASTPPTVAS
jgi:hypothetical protein